MLREIIDDVNIGLVVVGNKLDVRVWNRWMREATGIDSSDAYCRTLSDLLPAFSEPELQKVIKRVLDEGMSTTLSVEESKRIFPFSRCDVIIQPITGKNLFPPVAAIATDHGSHSCLIQFQQSAQTSKHPIMENNEGLISSEDPARLQFLTMIGHQIRTPVNGVLGVAELLTATPLEQEQRRYVELIMKSGKSLLGFINEMGDLALLESGLATLEEEHTDLPGLMQDVMDIYITTGSHKGVKVLTNLSADLPSYIKVDSKKLSQILVQLLNNAFQYTDRGQISLNVDVRNKKDGKATLVMTVKDTGVGIAASRIPHLFAKADLGARGGMRAYHRTGLGLFVCKELVELFDGDIKVESTVGRGTTFEVSIPVKISSQQPEQASHSVTNSEVPVEAEPWKVLIAEDNPVNQMVFRKTIENFGHRVKVVNNGQEAVRAVQLNPNYDVILMDITMPIMDGLEATALIRSLVGPVGHIPILALTAHALDGDRDKFLDAGMDGYQSKPVEPKVLLNIMAALIAEHKAKQAAREERARSMEPEQWAPRESV